MFMISPHLLNVESTKYQIYYFFLHTSLSLAAQIQEDALFFVVKENKGN